VPAQRTAETAKVGKLLWKHRARRSGIPQSSYFIHLRLGPAWLPSPAFSDPTEIIRGMVDDGGKGTPTSRGSVAAEGSMARKLLAAGRAISPVEPTDHN
jgi:hypothetical protein